ncbi:MAG: NAD(P)-dependent oxidoreductase [Deltaproteobacteria bacterium]|nr:NAD(P)-dependent oxidoreductase [Deltaproteobacteria bacterium]
MAQERAVLVSGAAGLLGQALLARLIEQRPGLPVLAVDRRAPAGGAAALPGGERVRWLELDLAAEGAAEAIPGPVSVTYHLAGAAGAASGPDAGSAFVRGNILSTLTLLEVARRSAPGTGILFVSSAAVYGAQEPPVPEGAPLRPANAYGLSKLQAEQWVELCGRVASVPWMVARPSNLVGPGQRTMLVAELALRLCRGERPVRLQGTGEELRDLIAVDEAARLLAALVERGAWGGCYNIGTGIPRRVADLALLVAETLGLGREVFCFDGRPGPGRVQTFFPDLTRLGELELVPQDRTLEACRELVREIALEQTGATVPCERR